MSCCCSNPRPICDFCSEGSNVGIDTVGFMVDGGQFSVVTDIYPQNFVIPGGCVNELTGHSTVCKDVLNKEWKLVWLGLGHLATDGDPVCVDYFGRTIDCASVVCWWYSNNYFGCINECSPDVPTADAAVCLGGDEVAAAMVVDASSDPDYVLLIIQIAMTYRRQRCCLTNGADYDGGPVYKMRVYYRVAKAGFTCLCPLCFTKYDEEFVSGEGVDGAVLPCLTWPDHVRVIPFPTGATPEQIANANATCGNPSNETNIDCAPPEEGCGETGCEYTASSSLEWVNTAGICINGCICPDNNALTLAGYSPPRYVGQKLDITIGCVPGDRPCSELLGRCCHLDGDGEITCTNNISECDCLALSGGCWNIGTGFDCDHPTAGTCRCTPIVGICCYTDGTGGHCLDNVTKTVCDGHGGSWVEQNEAGTYLCAGDHAGLTGCGPDCHCATTNNCGYTTTAGTSPTGYLWVNTFNFCTSIAAGCSCAPVDDAFYALHGYPASGDVLRTACAGCF